MNDFQQKPKRKRGFRNPYLFLGAGIVIGVLVSAILAVVILLFAGVQSDIQIVSTATPAPFAGTPLPTVPPPAGAQSIQGTPIANRIQAATISSNGAYLAYVSVEEGISHIYLNELHIEDDLAGSNRYLLHVQNGYFNDILFSPDGTLLIATIDSGFAILFDVRERTLIEEYAQIGGAAFTQTSDNLILVGRNSGIRIIHLRMPEPTLVASRNLDESSYTVGAVAVSQDNRLAIGFDNRVEIYDVKNLNIAPQIIEPDNGFVTDLAFNPGDANYLAIALAGSSPTNGLVQIYDLRNTSRSQFDFGTRVFAIAFSPDGEWLVAGGGESGYAETKLIAYRPDSTNNPIPADPNYYQPITFEGHEHTIFDVAFSREGYLLSAGWDGSVRLWDLFSPGNELSVYYP